MGRPRASSRQGQGLGLGGGAGVSGRSVSHRQPYEKEGDPMQDKVTRAFASSSACKAAPSISFGTAVRPGLAPSDDTVPGPGAYRLPSTLLRPGAGFSLRGRVRFNSMYRDDKVDGGKGAPSSSSSSSSSSSTPGPGHYPLKLPPDTAAHSFPKARPRRDAQRLQPGPGHYHAKSALERQVLSTKRSAPTALFGRNKAAAHAASPAMAPPAAAAAAGGVLGSKPAVGPGEYPGALVPACSPHQLDSRKRSQGGVPFGKASRDGKPASVLDRIGGGGAYVLPSAICVTGKGSPYRAAPAFSMSGREKFRSPF